ncbi:zinc finger protein 536 isoform X1 [Lates japonicus]|uniref:Zinc finger protein 536 isoform X1 n=1 Tax=Lates japonicus TaxID=270547 RepID=A0AAD3NEF3_LATJO|nr:zinc finger protein 536 isoform X1 [Lates japonicus]
MAVSSALLSHPPLSLEPWLCTQANHLGKAQLQRSGCKQGAPRRFLPPPPPFTPSKHQDLWWAPDKDGDRDGEKARRLNNHMDQPYNSFQRTSTDDGGLYDGSPRANHGLQGYIAQQSKVWTYPARLLEEHWPGMTRLVKGAPWEMPRGPGGIR